ncbi:MAG: HAMP domain-containing sensor histidine kinase, partial [Myxococcota bacterium]
ALARTFDTSIGGGTWYVVNRDGREVWRGPREPLPSGIADLVREARERGHAVRGGLLDREDLRLVLPVYSAKGEEGALVGAVPVGALWDRVAPLIGSAAWVLGMTSVVFITFGAYLLRRRIIRPIQEIAAASAEISAGRFGTRLEIPGSHELADLGRHFNQMAESLERQREALVSVERSLARGERLASVGRLAAGVAHEVGNPLAGILGFCEVALRDPKLSSRSSDALGSIKGEAHRIRELIRELLDLARSDEVHVGVHDPASLVTPIVERMRCHPDHGGVDLQLDIGPNLAPVRSDPHRVQQIMVNLIENAVHGVQEAESPTIQVRVRAVGWEGEGVGDFASEAAVALDVIDNGPGIPAEDLVRVFDPFFTTKDPGAGTGLGLWNAHRWAELLGGRLEVSSAPGRTRFSLFLPLADTQDRDGRGTATDH